MLPVAHRLRRPAQFTAVLRNRRAGRSGSDLLVVHAAHVPRPAGISPVPRVGFVVSKAVGNSVIRSRTARVLRHLVAEELPVIPVDVDVVVRAGPALPAATSQRVRVALHTQLRDAISRAR